MSTDPPTSSVPTQALPAGHASLLEDLEQRIHTARMRAALAVTRELVTLYWEIGQAIVARQEQEGWGRSVIERLSDDLGAAFPDVRGFSPRNLWRMRAFSLAWSVGFEDLPRVVADLPWGHNAILIEKLDRPELRLWYAEQVGVHGWSRDVLALQIQSGLHLRQGQAQTNFERTLPSVQSDLAQQMLKDPYTFDFLDLGDDALEREVERALVAHLRSFLLELGVGFAFVGNQVRVEVAGDEFFLDLLFYHLHLRCFVVIELKAGPFKPEYLGKLNFYLSAVDSQMRHPSDAPSIGLVLCREKNRLVVEYALRDLSKPVGVSAYTLTDSLPAELRGRLPTVEELEAELGSAEEP